MWWAALSTAEEPRGFRRSFSLATGQGYLADLRVRARPGDRLITLLLQDQPIGISASSDGSPDARASALAALDGDPGTTWTAALGDLRPELRLNWLTPRRISAIDLDVAP